MKRLFALLLVFACLAVLTACGQDPKDPVKEFFRAVKDRDPDAQVALLALTEEEKESYFYGLTGDPFDAYLELNRLSSLFPVYLAALAEQADFSVESETAAENEATVTVRAVYADCRGFFPELIPKVQDEIFAQHLNGTPVTLEKAFEIVLTRCLKELPEPAEHLLTLSLEKRGEEWKILPSPAVTSLCTFDLYTDAEAIFTALDNAGVRPDP